MLRAQLIGQNKYLMKSYELKKTACVAWSPVHYNPIIALGTMAGALDASFSTNAELELYEVMGEKKIFCMESSARFNTLAWSPFGEGSKGIIAAGLENGHLNIWNVNGLLTKQAQ